MDIAILKSHLLIVHGQKLGITYENGCVKHGDFTVPWANTKENTWKKDGQKPNYEYGTRYYVERDIDHSTEFIDV